MAMARVNMSNQSAKLRPKHTRLEWVQPRDDGSPNVPRLTKGVWRSSLKSRNHKQQLAKLEGRVGSNLRRR
jgi:hypothetical protein